MSGRRVGLAVLLAAAITSCADPGGRLTGGSSLVPLRIHVGTPQSLSAFQGPVVEQIRVYVIRFVNELPDTIATSSARFSADADAINLQILVPLQGNSEDLQVVLLYQTLSGVTLFTAQQTVTVTLGGTTSPPTLQPFYVGPGQDVDSIAITPVAPQVATGDSLGFVVVAFNGQRVPMPAESVYVNWSVSAGSTAGIGGFGVFHAPASAGTAWVFARTPATSLHPNGLLDSTLVTYAQVTPGGLTMTPDSVEKLPSGTQSFTVSGAPARSSFIWSVNGVDGGNTTFGRIDSVNVGTETAYYTAPAQVPPQPVFQVCARLSSDATTFGCAKVLVSPVPSAGTDVIVVNDMNLFDPNFMAQDPNNRLFAANLVNYSASGPRSNGKVVMYDRGRAASCFLDAECADGANVTIDSVLTANGFSIVKVDTVASWASIPSNVKVIFLWNPTIAYTTADINGFKAFASQGGRIVFLGEHVGFYGQAGIDTENLFLADMGSQFTNVGAVISCIETIPPAQISAHQTTTGLTSIVIACASQALPGPNDFPLFIESTGLAVAGVAKISTVPLPVPPAGAAAAGVAAQPTVRTLPQVDGLGRPR
jgi:hypothetical protein